MSQRRRWAAAEVIRRGLTLTSFVVVAKLLTVEDFATFILVATAFSVVVAVAQGSVDRLLVRLWLGDMAQARLTAQLATWISLLSTVVAALAFLSAGERRLSSIIALYGVSITGQIAFWAEENRYRAGGNLLKSNRAKTLGEIAPSLGRTAGAVIAGTTVAVCVGSAVGALGLLFLGRKQLVPPRGGKRLWRACRELTVSSAIGAATAAYWRIDLFILAALSDARAVSLYAIAGRGLEVALILPSVYGQLSIAEFLRSPGSARVAWAHGRVLLRVGFVLTALGIALSIPAAAVVRTLLDKPASPLVIAVLAMTIPAAFYGAVLGNILYATQQERMLVWVLLIMLVGNVALNILLIPWLGAAGAATATAVTESAGVAWLAWKLRPTIKRLITIAEERG